MIELQSFGLKELLMPSEMICTVREIQESMWFSHLRAEILEGTTAAHTAIPCMSEILLQGKQCG